MANRSTATETLIGSVSDPDQDVAAAAARASRSRTNADTPPVSYDTARGEDLQRTASDPDTPITDVAAAENMAHRCRNHMFIPQRRR